MIISKLTQVLEQNKTQTNQLLTRNLLKEVLQDYVLYFVYNHPTYKHLIFTGGTCLRKLYALPRLSEDLDFNYTDKLDTQAFGQDIRQYFTQKLKYQNLQVKLNKKGNMIFLKFPIMRELGLATSRADSPLLFLRCDFTLNTLQPYTTQVSSISTEEYTFFVLSYDLPTLFTNKIMAFLERQFFKGKEQQISFKGRDLFDLMWFLERTRKSEGQFKPNWERLTKGLKMDQEEILKRLVDKVNSIDPNAVRRDLLPFIENTETLDSFIEHFNEVITRLVAERFVE